MALRCLIVDDNRAFLKAAQDLLERQGVSVVGLASTGDEAIALARKLDLDVVLVDVVLGTESGFDLVHRLARELDGPAPPIVLISTYSESDFAELIASSPAIGFVSKSELSRRALDALLNEPRER